jgi:hypothetical protein
MPKQAEPTDRCQAWVGLSVSRAAIEIDILIPCFNESLRSGSMCLTTTPLIIPRNGPLRRVP